ncbi:MAG: preprotein translocase subunit SecE [Symbiobacteriia bacterium]
MHRITAIFAQLVKFFQDSRAEMRRVVWPTRRQTAVYTAVVLFAVVLFGAVIWGIDSVFSFGLGRILR